MFAILPLRITIAKFLKTRILEACRQCKLTYPLINRAVDAIGRRVANHPAHVSAVFAGNPKLAKYQADVTAVSAYHRVIVLLSTVVLAFGCKPLHDDAEFIAYRLDSV